MVYRHQLHRYRPRVVSFIRSFRCQGKEKGREQTLPISRYISDSGDESATGPSIGIGVYMCAMRSRGNGNTVLPL